MESTPSSAPTIRFDWTIPVWQVVAGVGAIASVVIYVNTIKNNVDSLSTEMKAIQARAVEYDALRADVRVINNQVGRLERMLERLLERRASNGELDRIAPGAGFSQDFDPLPGGGRQ